MEADFMELQAQFRGKVIILFLITSAFLFSCKEIQQKKLHEHILVLNKDSARGKYSNGLYEINNQTFTGTLFSLYDSKSDTAVVENYYKGKENGAWRKYYPGGILQEKRNFIDGKKSGEYLAWWQNGKQQLHYFFVDDEYSGECREWNDSGLLIAVRNFRKGYEEGLQKVWYNNGKIKANYIIKYGRRYGLLGTKNCVNVTDSIFK